MTIQGQCKTCFLIVASLATTHLACENGGEELAPEDFVDAMTEAYCDHIEKCELEWFFKNEHDMSCEDVVWYLTDAFEISLESVQAGRLKYDGQSAHECLSSLLSAECYFSEDTLQALMCDRAFTGKVDEGGTCYVSIR